LQHAACIWGYLRRNEFAAQNIGHAVGIFSGNSISGRHLCAGMNSRRKIWGMPLAFPVAIQSPAGIFAPE
jgi:hypothetical protein